MLKITQNNHNSTKITLLIRKLNLSSQRFSKYFNELIEKHLVIKRKTEKNAKVISITEKGQRYLKKYSNIIGFYQRV